MTMAEATSELYKYLITEFSAHKTRETISTITYLILSELKDEGINITPEEIEKRFVEKAMDYIEVVRARAA